MLGPVGLEAPGPRVFPSGVGPVPPALEGGLFTPSHQGSPVVFKTRANTVVRGSAVGREGQGPRALQGVTAGWVVSP